jgi:poly(A) polymerase
MVGTAKWTELFAKHDFFHRYKYYLQVIVSSDSIDDQRTWLVLKQKQISYLGLRLSNPGFAISS